MAGASLGRLNLSLSLWLDRNWRKTGQMARYDTYWSMGLGVPASIQVEVAYSFQESHWRKRNSQFLPVFTTGSSGGVAALSNISLGLCMLLCKFWTNRHIKTTIGRQQNFGSESRSCVILSNSRNVDEHTGGTNGVHILLYVPYVPSSTYFFFGCG